MLEQTFHNEFTQPIEVLRNKKAAIFDWDDTITQSFHFWTPIIADFIESEGYSRPDHSTFRKAWGKPLIDVFSHLVENASPDIVDRYSSFVPDNLEIQPVEGVVETLQRLKGLGYILGIVSSSSRKHLERSLGRVIPHDFFEFVQTVEISTYKKPDPRVFDSPLTMLHSQGIQNSEVLYVGDSLTDYFASRDANIDFVGVMSGVTTTEDFISAGLSQEFILKNASELFKKDNY